MRNATVVDFRLKEQSGVNEEIDFFRQGVGDFADDAAANKIHERIAFWRAEDQTGTPRVAAMSTMVSAAEQLTAQATLALIEVIRSYL